MQRSKQLEDYGTEDSQENLTVEDEGLVTI